MTESKLTKSIHGYQLERPFSDPSNNAVWSFADKDGKSWFIKCFYEPSWKTDPELLDPETIEPARKRCIKFFSEKRRLYDAVNTCDTGNIVKIHDFFRWDDGHFYLVMERVPSVKLTPTEVSKLPNETKLVLLKILALNFKSLHKKGIVYADLCPENVLFKKTATENITAKLIDFDGAFFENQPPKGGGLPIRDKYISPEVADIYYGAKKMNCALTTKIDVFSLGVLFHEYWTGERPKTGEYPTAGVAVLEEKTLEVSRAIPNEIRMIIERMLSREPADRPDMNEVVDVLMGKSGSKPRKDDTPTVAPSGFWTAPSDL